MREELPIDKVFGVVDDHHHYSLGHEIAGCLGHNAHIRVHQVTNGLHLSLQLWVHAASRLAVGTLQSNKAHI